MVYIACKLACFVNCLVLNNFLQFAENNISCKRSEHAPKLPWKYIWWSTKHDKYPRSHQHYRHLCAYLFPIILSISKYFPIQTGHKPRGCRCRLCIRKWETPHTLPIIFMTTGPGNESVWHCNTNITLLIFHFRQAFSAANLLNWLAVFSLLFFFICPCGKSICFFP